jgi:hypothetical protein
VLTIRQPWAWAIIHGGKDVENRSWSTKHRRPLLIHAGSAFEPRGYETVQQLATQQPPPPSELIHGAIIGVVGLVDCVRDSHSKWAVANPPRHRPQDPRGQCSTRSRSRTGREHCVSATRATTFGHIARPPQCSTWSSSGLAFAQPSVVGSKVIHACMLAKLQSSRNSGRRGRGFKSRHPDPGQRPIAIFLSDRLRPLCSSSRDLRFTANRVGAPRVSSERTYAHVQRDRDLAVARDPHGYAMVNVERGQYAQVCRAS